MKRLALALLACGVLTAQDLELSDAARQISAEFRKKNPSLDFHATLAVAKFKTSSERLQKNATADLVKASFEKEFVRSVYFAVVERENLDKVIAEIELRQRGLTAQKPADDMLKGAEYMLVGDLTEDSGNLIVSARLVQGTSGTVVATAQACAPLDSAEQAANAFRYNAFQSQYGITLGVDGSLVQPRGETQTSPVFVTAFLAYRIARPLRLGVRANVVLMPGMRLEQDVADMKVWSFDANGTFAQYQNYNFARRPDGRPVEMQMGFVFFDVGLSLHF